MTEFNDAPYPPEDEDPRVRRRLYDAKERLIAWSVQQDNHFLLFRIDAFREVTLENGEKLDVPETINSRFSETDIDPKVAFTEDYRTSCRAWKGEELEVNPKLQFNRARWHDPTLGRWISDEPLGHEPGDDNFFRHPQ